MQFINFGKKASGKLVSPYNTKCRDVWILSNRNPYGTHNLVCVDCSTDEACVHGDSAVLQFVINTGDRNASRYNEKCFRKIIKFLFRKHGQEKFKKMMEACNEN